MKGNEFTGKIFEEDGLIVIDSNIWMRPKTACERLQQKGLRVTYSLMNYWRVHGLIESIKIKSLDDLTLVNIESIPEEALKTVNRSYEKTYEKN